MKTCDSKLPATGSESARNVDLAVAELERARWALERKDWILARVYANHAIEWIRAAQRSDETE